MATMKTAISELQELMMKRGEPVQYEVVHQSGPPHQMIFKYQCTASGVSVIATGRSKKEAKQEAAAQCLQKLTEVGKYHPPPRHGNPFAQTTTKRNLSPPPEDGSFCINSYVALIKEYCEQYHLQAPVYELIGDSGPPHLRQFEVRVTVGAHSRSSVASTKKVARQVAAQKLYFYLKENLHKVTRDFDESEALVKATLKAQEKFTELKDEGQPWRPNLGQMVSERHLGLKNNTELSQQIAAKRIIAENKYTKADREEVIEKAESALRALELEFEWLKLPSVEPNKVVMLLNVPRADPSFAVASPSAEELEAKANTARQVLDYIDIMLQ